VAGWLTNDQRGKRGKRKGRKKKKKEKGGNETCGGWVLRRPSRERGAAGEKKRKKRGGRAPPAASTPARGKKKEAHAWSLPARRSSKEERWKEGRRSQAEELEVTASFFSVDTAPERRGGEGEEEEKKKERGGGTEDTPADPRGRPFGPRGRRKKEARKKRGGGASGGVLCFSTEKDRKGKRGTRRPPSPPQRCGRKGAEEKGNPPTSEGGKGRVREKKKGEAQEETAISLPTPVEEKKTEERGSLQKRKKRRVSPLIRIP